MAIRRYAHQVVTQLTEEVGEVIAELADRTEVSKAMVTREAINAGLVQHPLYESAVAAVRERRAAAGDERGVERVQRLLNAGR